MRIIMVDITESLALAIPVITDIMVPIGRQDPSNKKITTMGYRQNSKSTQSKALTNPIEPNPLLKI
jgi:hypothetical protein